MTGKTYYINPESGDDANTGMSPEQPFKTCRGRAFLPGDTIRFRRGSVIRDMLHTCEGADGQPITYSAYGDGARPVFLGSVPAGDPGKWIQDRPGRWRWEGTFPSEICNLVFNDGQSCGNLRWCLDDLQSQGEWFFTGIGSMSAHRETDIQDDVLYLCSESNPGEVYSSIECALWGQRRLASGKRHILLEDLAFKNSGVHGFQDVRVENVTIRNCEFRYIGGAVWNRDRRIRFGNAIELWNGARDVVIENCIFDNIYDSGVTHQGGDDSDVPQRIYFRNNRFTNCGMAAYECRGPSGRDIYFENNTCLQAGGGFSMQGEKPPRQSEIHPEPMGHHIFIWRMDDKPNIGPIYIRRNIFSQAPYGMAIYSMIDPAIEKRFIIAENCYWQTDGEMLLYRSGRYYRPREFKEYQSHTGQDQGSVLADPRTLEGEEIGCSEDMRIID